MEIKNGMHFVGNENGREIVIINTTPAAVTYRDLERKTVFTVGRSTFERCNIRPAEEEAPTTSPAGEWSAMSDEAKFAALLAAGKRSVATFAGSARRAGNITPNELAGDAWLILSRWLEKGDPRPLPVLLNKAASHALQLAIRANAHSVGGSRPEAESDDDNRTDCDLAEAENIRRSSGATARTLEDSLAISEAINAAAHDTTDAEIMRRLAAGYTGREIAAALNIAPAAVSKRLNGIRSRYNA